MSHNKEYENLLFAYYGNLLTNKQSSVLKDYLEYDYSMFEIAENYKVSKSAISDIINRALISLNDYEDKLHMIKQSNELDKLINEMEKENIDIKYIKKLRKINRG